MTELEKKTATEILYGGYRAGGIFKKCSTCKQLPVTMIYGLLLANGRFVSVEHWQCKCGIRLYEDQTTALKDWNKRNTKRKGKK